MKIQIDSPATWSQQTIIENLEVKEVGIIKSILELLDLQNEYFQEKNYYAFNFGEISSYYNTKRLENNK